MPSGVSGIAAAWTTVTTTLSEDANPDHLDVLSLTQLHAGRANARPRSRRQAPASNSRAGAETTPPETSSCHQANLTFAYVRRRERYVAFDSRRLHKIAYLQAFSTGWGTISLALKERPRIRVGELVDVPNRRRCRPVVEIVVLLRLRWVAVWIFERVSADDLAVAQVPATRRAWRRDCCEAWPVLQVVDLVWRPVGAQVAAIVKVRPPGCAHPRWQRFALMGTRACAQVLFTSSELSTSCVVSSARSRPPTPIVRRLSAPGCRGWASASPTSATNLGFVVSGLENLVLPGTIVVFGRALAELRGRSGCLSLLRPLAPTRQRGTPTKQVPVPPPT